MCNINKLSYKLAETMSQQYKGSRILGVIKNKSYRNVYGVILTLVSSL